MIKQKIPKSVFHTFQEEVYQHFSQIYPQLNRLELAPHIASKFQNLNEQQK